MAKTKPEAKPVLLDKTIRAALEFVSRDETRAVLTGIHITPDYVEATDSYRLVRITHAEGIKPMDYPTGPDSTAPAYSDVPPEGIIIEASAIKRALANMPSRSTLPILNRIALKVDGNYARLSTNDLDCVSAHTTRLIEGTFPDIDALLESYKGKPLGSEVAFNHQFMQSAMKAFGYFFGGYGQPVSLTCRGELTPFLLEAKNSSGQTMIALQMPVRMG